MNLIPALLLDPQHVAQEFAVPVALQEDTLSPQVWGKYTNHFLSVQFRRDDTRSGFSSLLALYGRHIQSKMLCLGFSVALRECFTARRTSIANTHAFRIVEAGRVFTANDWWIVLHCSAVLVL